jgi:hypothetical protein
MGYLGDVCDGPALLSSMLPHRRIEIEVAQRIRRCSNPGMVIDLARSVLVALFWAAGRGADGAGMSVKGRHRHSTPTLHGWRPVQPAEPAYPPFLSKGQAGDAVTRFLRSTSRWTLTNPRDSNTPLWVPAISVAGPLPVPWVEQWAINRLGKKFILFHVEPLPKLGRSRLARLLAHPDHWVGETQLALSKGYQTPLEYLGQPQLGSIITTLLSVVFWASPNKSSSQPR